MKVLTAEDLGVAAWEGIEAPLQESAPPSSRPQNGPLLLNEQQETFLQDRFNTKLEDPETGQWIRSWRADGE